MIDDIHDSNYKTPLSALKSFKHLRSEEYRYNEVTDVFWWVGFLLAAILGFFYSVGVYFTYFSEPEKFQESVDNSKRIENIKIEAIERAKAMNQSN